MEPEPQYETKELWKPTRAEIDAWIKARGWVGFEDFRFGHLSDNEKSMLQAAIAAATGFSLETRENPGRAFIILSDGQKGDNNRTGYGCGKTMLARSIYYSQAEMTYAPGLPDTIHGYVRGRFYEARELMAAFDVDNYEPGAVFRDFGRIIVIDDVGREGSLRWEKRDPDAQLAEKQARYYNVIDHCYRRGISIVITSNLNSRQLAAFLGGASWSRLLQMAPPAYRVNLTGLPDMRPQLAGF